MKIVFLFLAFINIYQVQAAARVDSVVTTMNISGLVGERDVMENAKFEIKAKLLDQVNNFHGNSQKIASIEITIGVTALEIPKATYADLSGVYLTKIDVSYIKQFADYAKSTIEVKIPFGKHTPCTNHDSEFTIRQKSKILKFKANGGYISSQTIGGCEH